MKLIALKLGLSENATEAEILAKLQDLQELQTKVTEKETEITKLQASAKEAEKKTIEKMVNEAIVSKKLTAEQKPHFISIGEQMGIDALQTTLSSMNGAVKPTDLISGRQNGQATSDQKWADLSDAERKTLRSEDSAQYIALFEKHYGFKPDIK
jgi:hypothetical protein